MLVPVAAAAIACGGDDGTSPTTNPPITNPQDGPAAGWADGKATIPAEGQPEDVSKPTTVIGKGTAASCTGDDFIAAVAKGGIITFDCGADPATITLTKPAKVFNDKGTKLVLRFPLFDG